MSNEDGRILIVDDVESVTTVITHLLIADGWEPDQIDIAHDRETAIDKILAIPYMIVVVDTDLKDKLQTRDGTTEFGGAAVLRYIKDSPHNVDTHTISISMRRLLEANDWIDVKGTPTGYSDLIEKIDVIKNSSRNKTD